MKSKMKLAAVSALAITALLCLSGCGGSSATLNPKMTEGVEDSRSEGKGKLVFREYKSSLYIVEIEGRRFLYNTNGGIVEL